MISAIKRIGAIGLMLLLLPWAALAATEYVATWQQLEDLLIRQAGLRKGEVTFDYAKSLSLGSRISDLSDLMHQAGMRSSRIEYSSDWARLYNIEYDDEFAVCRTEAEIRAYFAWCARYQVKDFALYVGKNLYPQLKAGKFSGIQVYEREVRITSRSLSYSDEAYAIYYEDTVYDSGAQVLSTQSQVTEKLQEAAGQLHNGLNLFLTDSLYRRLTADQTDLLQDMAQAVGIENYSYILYDGAMRIELTDIRYRAGHKMLLAYRTGNYGALTGREYDALVFAVNTLNRAGIPNDLLGAERWIHDYLCSRITYTVDDATDEDDCAVGALLNGEANCDGYADAFYLLGSLLGMEIRCQSGDALRSDGDAGHMWNLIRLNDEWYMVDVTWNDSDSGDPAHIWYNIGADFAKYSHTWQEIPGLGPMAEHTENGYRPYPIYRCYSFEELKNIMAECKGYRWDRVDIFYGYGQDLYRDTDKAYSMMRKGGVKGSIRSTWYDRPGFVHFYQLEY